MSPPCQLLVASAAMSVSAVPTLRAVGCIGSKFTLADRNFETTCKAISLRLIGGVTGSTSRAYAGRRFMQPAAGVLDQEHWLAAWMAHHYPMSSFRGMSQKGSDRDVPGGIGEGREMAQLARSRLSAGRPFIPRAGLRPPRARGLVRPEVRPCRLGSLSVVPARGTLHTSKRP